MKGSRKIKIAATIALSGWLLFGIVYFFGNNILQFLEFLSTLSWPLWRDLLVLQFVFNLLFFCALIDGESAWVERMNVFLIVSSPIFLILSFAIFLAVQCWRGWIKFLEWADKNLSE